MSLKLGSHQRSILDLLAATPSPLSLESVRWKLWERERAGGAALSTAWNTSLARALKTLVSAEKKLVHVESRKLESVAELLLHYPDKTLRFEVRKLRTNVLPGLFKWAESDDGPGPRFSRAENELYYFSTKTEKDGVDELRAAWDLVAPALISHVSIAGSKCNPLILLLAKGKHQFESLPVEVRQSFGELIRQSIATGLLELGLAQDLQTLSEKLLPPADARQLELKSLIHAMVEMPARGSWELKPPIMEHCTTTTKT